MLSYERFIKLQGYHREKIKSIEIKTIKLDLTFDETISTDFAETNNHYKLRYNKVGQLIKLKKYDNDGNRNYHFFYSVRKQIARILEVKASNNAIASESLFFFKPGENFAYLERLFWFENPSELITEIERIEDGNKFITRQKKGKKSKWFEIIKQDFEENIETISKRTINGSKLILREYNNDGQIVKQFKDKLRDNNKNEGITTVRFTKKNYVKYTYDKNGLLHKIQQIGGKEQLIRYEYEFDMNNNWIQQIRSTNDSIDVIYERKIKYYN